MDKNTVKEQILAIRDSGVTNMFGCFGGGKPRVLGVGPIP